MKKSMAMWIQLLVLLAACQMSFAQDAEQSQSTGKQSAPSTAATDVQTKNVDEYVELLRSDVRQQKAQIMGAVMELTPDQAAKFWPIYSEYDSALTKLNNTRIANIKDYADNYGQMTDAKADDLIKTALDFRRQRIELLAKYYGRVKAAVGSVEAARFVQIEDQMLLIVDLQIESSLPTVGR